MTIVNATPFEIALNGESKAPEWVQLLPNGPDIIGGDGRRWQLTDPSILVTAFNAKGRALPLDWEHATQVRGLNGKRADAAGWIEALEVRGGALWGRVSWTDAGRTSIETRGYRYLSPAFDFDPDRKTIHRMAGAGLVHHPNLDLPALNSESQQDKTVMDKSIADALGLNPDASAASVVTAINALKTNLATATNRAEKPDPEKYVPKADLDLALNKLGTFEEQAKNAQEAEIVEAVDTVIKAGDPSFPPARRDDFLAMCREEGGLDRFKRIAKPQLEKALNTAQLDGKTAPGNSSTLSEEERAICRQTGTSEADFLAAKKEQTAAGLI